jgi:hypothetical protein
VDALGPLGSRLHNSVWLRLKRDASRYTASRDRHGL